MHTSFRRYVAPTQVVLGRGDDSIERKSRILSIGLLLEWREIITVLAGIKPPQRRGIMLPSLNLYLTSVYQSVNLY